MKPAPFTHLSTFLSVARFGSFSRAAKELGVSKSAVSQSVRLLEEELRVVLLMRTTRSVSLTDAGRRLVDGTGPVLAELHAAMRGISADRDEPVGRLRLSVPRSAATMVIAPVMPVFCARYPRVEVEVTIEERFVDLVAENYDAGIRLSESIERDMVQVRLTDSFRFLIVGAPSYLAKHGVPERPQDLLKHQCITFRSQTTGAPYAWELERGRKTWRIPVRGSLVTNDNAFSVAMAESGLGLAYTLEPRVEEPLKKGRLQVVLERYAPVVPGFFLYFPSRAQRSTPLRVFMDTLKERLTKSE
jgi:DNA-binding transcriptional LysR family regulator